MTAEFFHVLRKLNVNLTVIWFLSVYDTTHNVEKILKGSLDSILSPSVKIQIMDRKVCFMCEGKKFLKQKVC